MLFNKSLGAIADIASSEDSRVALQQVKITPDKVLATDGYRMIEVELPHIAHYKDDLPTARLGNNTPIDPESILLNAQEFKKALSLIPKKASLPILNYAFLSGDTKKITVDSQAKFKVVGNQVVAVEPTETTEAKETETKETITSESVKIVSTDLETTNAPELKVFTGNFPDTDKVKPTEKVLASVSVNAKLLSELLNVMVKQEIGSNNIVEIEFRGKERPIVLKAKTEDKRAVEALIMPVRVV